jgi:hypothetical protein
LECGKMPVIKQQSQSAGGNLWTAIQKKSADATSEQLSSIPIFKHDTPRVGRHKHGSLKVGGNMFHKIADMNAFYAAMGYDKNARERGLCGEEFIWDRYIRDGSKMHKHCLQPRISDYLYKHSVEFKGLYGKAFVAMFGKCALIVIDSTDQHCSACPMHPTGSLNAETVNGNIANALPHTKRATPQ